MPFGRAAADCASIADTAERIGGQFIAASSNMFAYCEPWPEKTAATLPRVSVAVARKCAPCFGNDHFAAPALAPRNPHKRRVPP